MRNAARNIKTRRLIRLGSRIVLVVGPIVLVTLWLVFQHKPGWYRPPVVTETMLQHARTTSAATADDVSKRIVDAESFQIVLTDEVVNEWLAALPHLWPDARRSVPPEVSDLAVQFEDGQVRVGALYADDGWRAIVSIGLFPAVSRDGKTLRVTLTGAKGGSLPVPRMILRRILSSVLERGTGARDQRGDGTAALGSAFRDLRSADELFEGVRIRNRFVWPNGDRPLRIDSIEVDGGELRLRIEPL